jgi:hypothetical protein
VPAAGLRVQAGPRQRLTLRARRFADDQWVKVGLLSLPPGRAVDLHPLRDASPVDYVLRAARPARVCRLGA